MSPKETQKKQYFDLLSEEIGLSEEEKEKYFRKGNTITREWFVLFFKMICKIKEQSVEKFIPKLKQDITKAIGLKLGCMPEENWFSKGSTVTGDALHAIYNAFIDFKEDLEFNELTLPVLMNNNSYVTAQDLINTQQINVSELLRRFRGLSKRNVQQLVKKRIEMTPHYCFMRLDNEQSISLDKEGALQAIEKHSEIGEYIVKEDTDVIEMVLEHLSEIANDKKV